MARIAIVHDIAGVGAVQAGLLREAGHEVDQVALPQWGAGWRRAAKAIALPVRLAAYLPVALKLRRGRYDVIHIHFLSQGIVGVLAGRTFFAQAHGSDLHANLHNPVYRRVTRAVLERAKSVFYVTPNLRAYLDRFGEKLVYLPNPVRLPAGTEVVPAPSDVRRVVIFTRLHAVKGVEQIFPAVEALSAMVELTAFDSGPLAHEYVRRYGSWVTFVPPVPHREIWSFIGAFDAVIGQMRQGVLGLMEIEALAAGRPLIAAVDGALYSDDPPPVVNVSGPEEIVAAITRLKSNPAELKRLSEQGRAWAERNHSYARHLQSLEAAYFGARGAAGPPTA
ncbi:MAG TPA: glycosyltransferase family 4 protein [Candidatus Dormibacteraeota bacterium]